MYLAGVPVVDEERNGGAQVGEEEVQGELMVPTQPARQRAQVEDEEAQGDDDALPHLGTRGGRGHVYTLADRLETVLRQQGSDPLPPSSTSSDGR